MKNKIIVLMFALGGLVSSCSDAYDIVQKGDNHDPYEVYRNADDVRLGINAIYSSIPSSTEVSLSSIFTDEVSIGLNNGGQGVLDGEYTFMMEADNSYAASIWSSYYAMIHRINRLEEISKKLMEDGSAAQKTVHEQNLAELYVLRAFAHYKLFAYFTPDYKNNSGLSAIILDHVPPTDYTYSLPRNTVKEVKDFILNDLETAESLRTTSWGDANYVNAGAINAIRVKLFSMTEEYDKVIEYGEQIMSQYTLSNGNEYANLFARVDANYIDLPDFKEVIFRSKSTINTGPRPVSIWYSARASSDGSFFYEMGRSLYNELDKLDPSKLGQAANASRNDVRYGVNLLPSGIFSSNTGSKVLLNYENASLSEFKIGDILLIGKYRGTTGNNLANNVNIFRVSDILLAMAEARAFQQVFSDGSTDPDDIINQRTSVYSILYTLRYNRLANTSDLSTINLSIPTNSQQAYKAILDERRVEFAFEGHRYLDMKRLGVKANSEGFVRYSKDCADTGACQLPANSNKLTLPIPVGELNGNLVLTSDQQNPGY